MAWVTHDFQCDDCSHVFEEMYKRSEREQVQCPVCRSWDLTQLLSAPRLQSFSMLTPAQKRESLKRRSAEHTQRQIDKEPEKWGEAGLARRSKKVQG